MQVINILGNYFFYLVLFFLGEVFMRSAGCIFNDILDKHLAEFRPFKPQDQVTELRSRRESRFGEQCRKGLGPVAEVLSEVWRWPLR